VVVVIDACVAFGAAWVVAVTIAMVVVGPGVGVAVVEGARAAGVAVVCDGIAVVAARAGSTGTASGKMTAGTVAIGDVISTVGGAGASVGNAALGFVGVASAGFVVVTRGLKVVVEVGFGVRVVGGTVGLVVGFGAGVARGMASDDVVSGANVVVGTGTALAAGTTEVCGMAAAERTVVGVSVVGASVVGETVVVVVDVEEEVAAMEIVGAIAAARELGVATVEGAADETTATDDGGRATVVADESDWLTTMGLGASSEPTPEATKLPISVHTNAATASNLRLRERVLGKPSPRHESERNAEVPVSERENAASRT
jgi:hypothetical protein